MDQIKRISCVNVGFTVNDGREDETQIHVHNLLCSNGTAELSDLFSSLAEELNTKISRKDGILNEFIRRNQAY